MRHLLRHPSKFHTMSSQTIYIITSIHSPHTRVLSPHCYCITGAYTDPAVAQTAMKQNAKDLPQSSITEWKEEPFKIEFKAQKGEFGICWIDERRIGTEE